MFNVTYRKLPEVLSVLENFHLSDIWVVFQRGVESILLIKDNNEARRVMQTSPPKNTNEVCC